MRKLVLALAFVSFTSAVMVSASVINDVGTRTGGRHGR